MKKAISILASCAVIGSCLSSAIPSTGPLAVYAYAEAISILSQPQSQTAVSGTQVSFTVEAEGEGLTYRWRSRFKDGTWGNSSSQGNRTDTLTINASDDKDGAQYKCIITDKDGNSITSKAATLTIKAADPIIINTQPQSQTAVSGASVSFTVEAEGEGLTYRWQSRFKDGTWAYSPASGNKTKTLRITASDNKDGAQYKCIITDKDGNTLESDPATLTIKAADPIIINTQPQSQTAVSGDQISFTVEAEGEGLTYCWRSRFKDGSWANSKSQGNKTNTLTITASDNKDGAQYKCIITDKDGNTLESDPATLTIKAADPIIINTQPQSQTAVSGASVSFTVEAEGEGLTYRWQSRFKDGTWAYSPASGNKTKTLRITASDNKDGAQYKCIITDADGNTLESYPATLTIASPITLVAPASVTLLDTASAAVFTVAATGTGDLTYLWESSVDGNTWTAVPDSNSATLTVSGADAVSGIQYRCTVSDAYGQSKTSEPATLTVEASSAQCGDDLTYTYQNGTMTISGTGEMWSYTDASSSPFASFDIDDLIIEDGVTVIGAHAFENNSIQSVTLPESVFSIRYKAFWGNDDLDITIENIGCAIYEDALPDRATVHGYSYSSAYYSSQGEERTFIDHDNDCPFDASTNKIVLTVGDTYQIEANSPDLRCYSFNPDSVIVDLGGFVTAVGVNENDSDAKVMVYDKAGRSTVYYFSVVNQENTGNSEWRYQVISPSSWNQTLCPPIWGYHVSLNEDVAYIVNDDVVTPTRCFGTAPILSVDEHGNSNVFYYTYDADIRPIKADTSYTEKTFEFTNDEYSDWERTYHLPFYSYTAEEDTRVYFKAYGSEDLDVTVYDAPGGNEIVSDWNGGRAEVEFDVAAGQTVYIQPTAGQNQAFTYTMKLSTSAIETVAMTDNEVYTITPDTAGDLTTFSFTAPADGQYLIEGKSDASFCYELANNADFANVGYDENGYAIENTSNWDKIVGYSGFTLAPCYEWLTEGETVYIRGYFNDEPASDDTISFRVHAVTPNDTALTLNDIDDPNVVSLDPDDYDRRTIAGKADAQYRISIDLTDIIVRVLDKDWNEVSLGGEQKDTVCIYSFDCYEDQTYHVIIIPKNASDNYGSVNVWVSENTNQDIVLWDTYTFYNTDKVPANYSFTAPTTGYYYVTSEYIGVTSYEYTDENGLVYEESFDPQFSMIIKDNEYNYLNSFGLNPFMCERDSAFYLEEGQEVYIEFLQSSLIGSDHFDFSINLIKPGVLMLDGVQTNALDENSYSWYEFTAPADGTYLFSVSNDDPFNSEDECYWFSFCFFTEYGQELNTGILESDETFRDMTKDETIWVRIGSGDYTPLTYRIVVRDCNQPYNTDLLENTAWYVENSDCASIAMTEDGFTLTVTDAGDEAWNTQVFAADLTLFAGSFYKLTFTKEAETESETVPEVLFQQNHSPYIIYGGYNNIDLNSDVSEICFTAEGTSGLTKLLFDNFGVGTYTFSDISLVRITEEEYYAWTEPVYSELINDANKWSTYLVYYASDDPTYTFDADRVDIELPVCFDGYFGAKYSGIDLTAGKDYTLSFDLLTDGMASADVYVKDSYGTTIEQFYGAEFGMDDEAQTNTFTFTATEDHSDCVLIFEFYSSAAIEGSIPSNFVTVSNISLAVTG